MVNYVVAKLTGKLMIPSCNKTLFDEVAFALSHITCDSLQALGATDSCRQHSDQLTCKVTEFHQQRQQVCFISILNNSIRRIMNHS